MTIVICLCNVLPSYVKRHQNFCIIIIIINKRHELYVICLYNVLPIKNKESLNLSADVVFPHRNK